MHGLIINFTLHALLQLLYGKLLANGYRPGVSDDSDRYMASC